MFWFCQLQSRLYSWLRSICISTLPLDREEEEQQAAFDALKKALTLPPVLALPTPDGEFILDTDASTETIGTDLSQIQDGQ